MMISNEELRTRREVLCEKLGVVKEILSHLRVSDQYKDDLIQEIFITAYKNVEKVNDMNKINSWLYKLSYRKMLVFMQKQREIDEKEILYSPEEWEREEFKEAENILVWDIMDECLNDGRICDLVAKLKWPAPQIIKLRFVDGFKLTEIADMMNLKYNTVKTIEYRAFKQLKHMIEQEGKGADSAEDQQA